MRRGVGVVVLVRDILLALHFYCMFPAAATCLQYVGRDVSDTAAVWRYCRRYFIIEYQTKTMALQVSTYYT